MFLKTSRHTVSTKPNESVSSPLRLSRNWYIRVCQWMHICNGSSKQTETSSKENRIQERHEITDHHLLTHHYRAGFSERDDNWLNQCGKKLKMSFDFCNPFLDLDPPDEKSCSVVSLKLNWITIFKVSCKKNDFNFNVKTL